MKYANRPLALLVAGALVVTLAGCSNSAVSTLTASSAAGTVLSATETEFSLEGATAFTFTDSGISAAEGDYNGYTIRGLPAGCAAVHGGRGLPVCAIRRGHTVLPAAHAAEACAGFSGLGGSSGKGGAAGSERIVTVGGNFLCAVEHIVCIAQGGAAVYGIAAGIGNGKSVVFAQAHGAVCAHAAAIGHIALRSVDGVAHTRAAACCQHRAAGDGDRKSAV